MPAEPLTDAETAALEAEAPMRLHGLDPDEEAALFAAIREARGLVAALALAYDNGRDQYGFCDLCACKLREPDKQDHFPDCEWDAIHDAKAAWAGEEVRDE